MRRFLAVLILFMSLQGCSTVAEVGAERLGVSVMTVNLMNIYNAPEVSTPAGVPWKTRYKRFTDWIGSSRNVPDVIAFQEMPGYWDCAKVVLRDYTAVDFLLDELQDRTGVRYRVAYALSHKLGAGSGDRWIGDFKAGGCPAREVRALFYRPDVLRNTQSNTGFAFNDESHTAPHLLNSIPCCRPEASRADVCAALDGPPLAVTGCDTPTVPAGAAWTLRQSPEDNPLDAVFTRFELVKEPGNFFHVYNVHLFWKKTGPNPGDETAAPGINAINALVTSMEARFGGGNSRLYPPLVLGDFNLDDNAVFPRPTEENPFPVGPFPRFDKALWSPELMGALIGKQADFPSKQRAYIKDAQILPALGCLPDGSPDPATLWSDHCASLFFRLEPAP
jgi:hypothetical protein